MRLWATPHHVGDERRPFGLLPLDRGDPLEIVAGRAARLDQVLAGTGGQIDLRGVAPAAAVGPKLEARYAITVSASRAFSWAPRVIMLWTWRFHLSGPSRMARMTLRA
jgi:hypothetical protein